MERLWTRSFVSLTLTLFFLSFGFYLLLPTLPSYIKEYDVGETQVGLVIGVFTLAAVIARPLVGGLLDRYGRWGFIAVGLLLFALSMLLYNWAGGILLLLLLRIFHGFSWAVATTSIGTSITDVIPVSRRGEGMGWYGLSMTVSMAIGPMVGVWIIQGYSFSSLFFLAAALTVVALLLSLATRVPFTRKEHSGKINFFDRSLASISVAIFFLTFTYGGITTFMPLFAESIQVNAGTFFMIYAIALTITRPIAGKLADRFSESVVMFPAFIMMSAALLVLSFTHGMVGIIISAILYGIGFGSAQPTLQAAMLRLVAPHKKGVANASFFTAFDLGIGLGAIVLGPVSQYGGYAILFAACAVSGLISLFVYSMFVRKQLVHKQPAVGSH